MIYSNDIKPTHKSLINAIRNWYSVHYFYSLTKVLTCNERYTIMWSYEDSNFYKFENASFLNILSFQMNDKEQLSIINNYDDYCSKIFNLKESKNFWKIPDKTYKSCFDSLKTSLTKEQWRKRFRKDFEQYIKDQLTEIRLEVIKFRNTIN